MAVDAALDTDTFRSIFRTAVAHTHRALLAGDGGGSGLNLSDSIAIITTTLQLPGSAQPGSQASGWLGDSLADVTGRLDDYRFWQWQDITAVVLLVAIGGAVVCSAGAIALARDRRRMVHRLGWTIVIGGGVVVLLVRLVQFMAGRLVDDAQLAAAVRSAIGTGMADLTVVSLWVAGYGVIVAAASTRSAAVHPDGRRRHGPGVDHAPAAHGRRQGWDSASSAWGRAWRSPRRRCSGCRRRWWWAVCGSATWPSSNC